MNGLSSVGPEGIFRRTPKGQSAVTSRRRQLSACEFSLLLMVNGFTPTHYLAELASMPVDEAEQALSKLEQQGFIEKV